MIDGLRPYPEMRPSGLPWLGNVPTHWQVRRNGQLFGSRRETGFPDLPVLEVSLRSGVRVRDFANSTRKQEIADRSKYQRAARGDIAYNMMRMWQGAVGIAPVDGLVSPAYVVARPFEETHGAYYAYLFRTKTYMREIDTFSRGIVPDRNRLYWESFKQMPSVYPPLEEQALIVRLLDWHGVQTTKLIRTKRKIIALLNEQKQAIIHRAVTRGLDPNAKLMPSGIPWLGDVPEGWDLKRFKFLTKIRNGQVDPRLDEYKSQILVAPNHIQAGTARLLSRETAAQQGADSGKYQICAGDIVYSKIRPKLRKAILSEIDGLCSADMYPIVVSDREIEPGFLLAVMLSDYFTRYAVDCSMRVAMPKINREALGNCWIAFPSRAAQRAIVGWISDESRNLDQLIERIECEISLVQEFRTCLIADVVTGKLDVRALAATLPEFAGKQPIEEAIDDEEFDEPMDDAESEEIAA